MDKKLTGVAICPYRWILAAAVGPPVRTFRRKDVT
ncbi:MAG: hypothetical protein JWL84_4437, partial [Rhodospirillales bacterium]|nr:hypothetical protein [Rhodospirillales bacterium]